MKITRRLFNELPQLDRIEFRQREDLINKKYGSNNSWYIQNFIFNSLILYVLVLLFKYAYTGYISEQIIRFSILTFFIAFIFISVGILVDLIEIYQKRKYISELENHYFKIEVKDVRE